MLLRFLLAACSLVFFLGHAGTASAADKVTLRLDWSVGSYQAPFFLAEERGYYTANGLDLEIVEGKGSLSTMQLVGRGNDTFGYVDASALPKAVSAGIPIKMIAGILKRSLMSIVIRDEKLPQVVDLKGKTLTVTAGDAQSYLVTAFLKANKLPADSIKLMTVDPGAKYKLIIDGKADGTVTYGVLGIPFLESLEPTGKFVKFDFADSGVGVPSFGLIASDETIKERPDLVRRFVQATARGWEAARKDPEAALAAVLKKFPQAKNRDAEMRKTIPLLFDYIDTENTKGKPFGWMSPTDWAETEKLLVEYLGLKPAPSVNCLLYERFRPVGIRGPRGTRLVGACKSLTCDCRGKERRFLRRVEFCMDINATPWTASADVGSETRGVPGPMTKAETARAIEFHQLAKTFTIRGKSIAALRDLNISIGKREFVSVVGPSGCGKSTLMLLAAGLELPTEGDVLVNGIQVSRPVTDVGIVFQKDVLFDWRTVLGNILLQAEVRGLPKEWALMRANDLIERVGLGDFRKAYPWQLSGGMRQRVAICRALLHDTSLLMMDEPFGALDAFTRDQMITDLQRVWLDNPRTALFITHDIAEAVFLSDRVLVMSPRPGRIVADIAIGLPRPRHISIRERADFVEYQREIRAIFRSLEVIP